MTALVVGLFLNAVNAVAEPAALGKKLDAIFDSPVWKSTWWGVKIVDLDTSVVLYERNAEKAFMPASNMKLVTTAAVLSALGPDYKLETKLAVNGPVNADGVLQGDLIIVGGGDPSISNRFAVDRFDTASRRARANGTVEPETAVAPILDSWIEAIRKAGIKKIEGAVIGDDDVFTDSERPGTWQLDYYTSSYAAESSGLAIKENTWDVNVFPGAKVGEPARLEVPLGSQYVKFVNNIVTTGSSTSQNEDDSDSSWPDPSLDIERGLENNEVTLSGTIVLGRPVYKESGAIHNGTLYAATFVAEALKKAGIDVADGPVDCDDLKDKSARLSSERIKVIHTHQSPPVSELIRIVNKPSQNFYADMLMRALGAKLRKRPASFDLGDRAVKEVLVSAGLTSATVDELRMEDGSGLSRQNRVTPALIMDILIAMTHQPANVFKAFHDSLPIMGVDGTLRTRMPDTPAEGKVHAKTGTINGVRSLSGYLSSADGHRLAFSMIANQHKVATRLATEAQDEALLLMLAHNSATTGSDSGTTSTGISSGSH